MTGDGEDAVARAARVRREVARTIERVRAQTAEIGHGDDDGSDAAHDAEGAAPPADEKKGGVAGEVGALLARTRAVIARTKSVIEHTRAALEHDHGHDDEPAEADAADRVDAKE